MAYKVKRKRKLPETYFRKREIQEIMKKHKGRFPVEKYSTEIPRLVGRFPRRTHHVNQLVIYNGKEYIVRKVSRKGVHLSRFKKNKKGLIEGAELTKPIFVPEKKYSGKAVPYGFVIFMKPF